MDFFFFSSLKDGLSSICIIDHLFYYVIFFSVKLELKKKKCKHEKYTVFSLFSSLGTDLFRGPLMDLLTNEPMT